MRVTRFNRRLDLIIVSAWVWGRRDEKARLRLVVDTGAAVTLVAPDVLDQLGYSARDGEARTTIRSAIGEEPGYLLRVKRFRALGYRLDELLIHVHDLPGGHDIDGLLGWNFLQHFNVELRPTEGRIRVTPVERAR